MIRRGRRLTSRHFDAPDVDGELRAMIALGYAFGSRRRIDVAPVRPPIGSLNDARPTGVGPWGARSDLDDADGKLT